MLESKEQYLPDATSLLESKKYVSSDSSNGNSEIPLPHCSSEFSLNNLCSQLSLLDCETMQIGPATVVHGKLS